MRWRNRNAQGLVLAVGIIAVLLSIALGVILRGIDSWEGVRTQVRLDSVSLTGCSLFSETLNQLAGLNKKISYIERLMDGLVAYWNGLAICASACVMAVGCACVAELAKANISVPERLNELSKFGQTIEASQDILCGSLPIRLDTEMTEVARQNRLNRHVTQLGGLAVERESTKNWGNLNRLISANPVFSLIHYPRRLKLNVNAERRHFIRVIKAQFQSVCRVRGDNLDEADFEEQLAR